MRQKQPPKVAVFGAGIAGLACAQTLHDFGIDYQFFEASDLFGGRIKSLNGYSNFPLEAGGQQIHCKKTKYYKMAQQAGAQLKNDYNLVLLIWDEYQQKIITDDELEKKYPKVSNVEDDFEEYHRIWNDCSVEEQLKQQKYDPKFDHFYKGILGGEFGASLQNIGSKGIGLCDERFLSSCNYNFYNIQHQAILEKFYHDAIGKIQYNHAIKEVVLNKEGKVELLIENVKETNTFKFTCDFVVSCVPITQVKKIKWYPEFSNHRKQQLNLIGMEKGGKLLIKLDKKLFHKNVDLIFPKINHNALYWNNSSNTEFFIFGIICEDGDMMIKELGIEQFAQQLIDLINLQFKSDVKIIAVHYEDWGSRKYIEGLYSYPKPGIKEDYIHTISQPIENKIFFAGEAHHTRYFATIHGAMETGQNAANAIINIIKQQQ